MPSLEERAAGRARVSELAILDRLDYNLIREEEAEKLGIRKSELDKIVDKLRSQGTDGAQDCPDAWPEQVDGAELLSEISETLKRFVCCDTESRDAVALWTILTYLAEAVDVLPLLALTSPEKRCGKTTTIDVLIRLVKKPIPASNISPAALFRSVEQWSPTLLIDEADTFLRQNEELRGILNSGHTRASAYVVRTVGDNYEPKQFSTWSPKVVAKIGKLPDTLHDRSIVIELRRKLPSEKTKRLRHAEPKMFEDLRAKLVRWSQDNSATIRASRPKIPEFLNDRAGDNWEPLLAIAEAAGGDWPMNTLKAAKALSSGDDDADSTRVKLLADMRGLFEKKGDLLSSSQTVDELAEMEERPWPEFSKGKPITTRQLARLLKPYGIRPLTRRDGGQTFKGYHRKDFGDAFARYLPSSVTASHPNGGGAFDGPRSVTAVTLVTDGNPLKPHNGGGCDSVTDGGRNPPPLRLADTDIPPEIDQRMAKAADIAGIPKKWLLESLCPDDLDDPELMGLPRLVRFAKGLDEPSNAYTSAH